MVPQNLKQVKPMSPNDLGRKFIVEECQKIELSSFLNKYRKNLKEAILGSEIEALNTKIEIATSRTGYGGTRYWFRCPRCEARVGVLHKHPLNLKIGCRKCLNLYYRKQRYKGMIESEFNHLTPRNN